MTPPSDEFPEMVTKVLADNTAQSVLNHLKELESNRDHVRTRWAWELLQNARDTPAGSDSELIICIERNEDELVFKHNGANFSLEEIAHLIYHGSTKVEEEDAIGQYGSGFLTTHLLSPEINVSGQIMDDRFFDFRMRREISSVSDLRASMQKAQKKFIDSLSEREIVDDFTTKYQYPLTDNVFEVVDAGILSLKKCAPFILAFNSEFSTINIEAPDGSTSFSVDKRILLEQFNFEQIEILEISNGDHKIRQYLMAHGDNTSIAVPTGYIENGRGCLPIYDIPRLFLGFPLIGTEDFSFPAVINSLMFTPTENRDGVYLGQSNDQTNTKNQTAIKEAGKLLITMLRYAASSNWKNMYLLGEFSPIQPKSWLNPDWLRNQFKEFLIPEIRRTPAILSTDGVVSAEESVIPFTEKDVRSEGVKALRDLLDGIADFRKKLPKRCESVGWCNAIESWADILGCEVTNFEEVIDGSNLVSYVEDKSKENGRKYGDLTKLQVFLQEDVVAADWLNLLFQFLQKYKLQDVIRTRYIIPDQSGYLDRLSELHRDRGISGELKDIASNLEWDIREELRDTSFTSLEEEVGAGDRDDDYVVKELIRNLQERADENPDAMFAEASVRLFSWIVGQKNWTLLRGFPVFAQESDGDNRRIIKLESDTEADARPLVPVSAWVEDLQRFSDLFSGRYTLANEFIESTPDPAVWQILSDKGFLRKDVVIVKDVIIKEMPFKTFLPDEHLTDDEDHETSEHVTMTSVAFMTKEDVGIMARVRQSQYRARLFWQFITEWLIPRDSVGLEIREAPCICENDHRYYPAQWLIPLRSNKWVPRSERRTEQATASSLANLLRKGDRDFSLLSEPQTTTLLEAMGVSRFDLMRELLVPDDDDIRSAMDNVLMDVLEAAGGKMDRLSHAHQYLKYLKGDPDLPKFVKKRQDRIEQVRKNQKLGALVEDLVKQNLEKKGFMVRRTGIGSDFEIEPDSPEAEDLGRLHLKRSERT